MDRGKGGIKRSTVVDAKGIPLGTITAPANRHDSPLLSETLETAVELPEHSSVHLGRAYDSKVTRETLAHRHLIGVIRFAFASCQQFEHGYYTAYRHISEEDLDLVVHLGDYIYEYGIDEYVAPSGNVRHHNSPKIFTLPQYRNRYALYRSASTNLRAAHAAFPRLVTWDDHEVENNYADGTPGSTPSVEEFPRRRAAAYQAYYEHMPLRRSSMPQGPDICPSTGA